MSSSYASTEVYTRTDDNLGITKNITITDKVKRTAMITPKVDASEKIYDFADLLSDSEEELLYQNVMNYIEKYDMDMAIVTINNNPKSSSMDYADDFYDYNDFGFDDVYSGILFLIDMDNREMWISTTGQAILIYNDYRIESILDDTYEYVTKDDFLCANAFIEKASKYAEQGIPANNQNYTINSDGEYVRKPGKSLISCLSFKTEHNYKVIIIIASIIDFITIIVLLILNKTVMSATNASSYVEKIIWHSLTDKLVHTHTSRVYHSPDSGGSSGGGSSSHSGSSGISHGGGGRSF